MDKQVFKEMLFGCCGELSKIAIDPKKDMAEKTQLMDAWADRFYDECQKGFGHVGKFG